MGAVGGDAGARAAAGLTAPPFASFFALICAVFSSFFFSFFDIDSGAFASSLLTSSTFPASTAARISGGTLAADASRKKRKYKIECESRVQWAGVVCEGERVGARSAPHAAWTRASRSAVVRLSKRFLEVYI